MGPKYPVVDPAPSLDVVTANFGFGEYFTWFGLTAVSLPLGWAAGEYGPRRLTRVWVWMFVRRGESVG